MSNEQFTASQIALANHQAERLARQVAHEAVRKTEAHTVEHMLYSFADEVKPIIEMQFEMYRMLERILKETPPKWLNDDDYNRRQDIEKLLAKARGES